MIAPIPMTSLLLERLGALIQQSVREDAARHGLLPIHVQVLHYLERANLYSDMPIALADYFGITRGTVSQTITVLERRGLLVRERDARHGKRVHLRLTPAAHTVLEGSWVDRVESVLQARSPDSGSLEGMLRGLLVALQRINGQTAFGICRQCAHFQTESNGTRCGLTGEVLADEQTGKICREWTAPASEAALGLPGTNRF